MRSGIKTIITGAGLLVLGAIAVPLAIVLIIVVPIMRGDALDKQFRVPGTAEVKVEEPGRYRLWNDYRTVFEGESFDRSETLPDGIKITIRDGDTGEQFDLVSRSSLKYTSGSRSQKSIGHIDVTAPGTIVIEVEGEISDRIFSFSRSRLSALLWLVLAGIALSGITTLSGLGIAVWGIVRLVNPD